MVAYNSVLNVEVRLEGGETALLLAPAQSPLLAGLPTLSIREPGGNVVAAVLGAVAEAQEVQTESGSIFASPFSTGAQAL